MVHLFIKLVELGLLVSVLSTVWKETEGCAKHFRCALVIYFMNMLSYLYDIIIYCAIDAPSNGNNFVNGHNATDFFI